MQTTSRYKSSDKGTPVSIRQLAQLFESGTINNLSGITKISDKQLVEDFKFHSRVKRFFERCKADPGFKLQVFTAPEKALNYYDLDANCEKIKSLREQNLPKEEQYRLLAERSRDFLHETVGYSSIFKISAYSSDPRYKAWRERQIARNISQLPKWLNEQIVHSPISFELSKGCSVGCWFCSVSAPKLGDIFFYTHDNAKLWRDVLELLKDMLGSAAGGGFCYWATDPLDNLDYEKFLCDFHSILGVFPQTTTAQALKAPLRTRSLLKLALEKGCKVNRFSILSLKMLSQVFEEFSPEELAFVELVLQNKEIDFPKANAGRMREYNKRLAEKIHDEGYEESLPGTNACVTGFLFNMLDRSVKLISPYPSSDCWPNGYRIYDQGTFTNADDLRILLERMIDRHMPLSIRLEDYARFRSDLTYESLSDGFQLSTRFQILRFRNAPHLKQLGETICKGDKTIKEIISLFDMYGVPSASIYHYLDLMFSKGVLDDEQKKSID